MKKIVVRGKIDRDSYIDINCYIIDYKGKCFIVDPGYEKEKIIEAVKENNLEVLGILLTHSHLDHISAINSFNVPVYIGENEYNLFLDNYENSYKERGLERPFDLKDINIIKVNKDTEIEFLDKKITVIETPGHTEGGVCYKFEDDLFTGDTLFKRKVGRWDFKTGNLESLKKSVVFLIENLSDEVRVHPGHMESTTIGDEKKYNPYYNEWK